MRAGLDFDTFSTNEGKVRDANAHLPTLCGVTIKRVGAEALCTLYLRHRVVSTSYDELALSIDRSETLLADTCLLANATSAFKLDKFVGCTDLDRDANVIDSG